MCVYSGVSKILDSRIYLTRFVNSILWKWHLPDKTLKGYPQFCILGILWRFVYVCVCVCVCVCMHMCVCVFLFCATVVPSSQTYDSQQECSLELLLCKQLQILQIPLYMWSRTCYKFAPKNKVTSDWAATGINHCSAWMECARLYLKILL